MSMDNPLNGSGLAYFWQKLKTLLAGKVDKETGKGLSTNDYTTAEKNKLAGIAAGAQVNSVTGVKGSAESSYRTGNVNLTAANVGAAAASHRHSAQELAWPAGLRGVNDVTIQPLISSARANRLAFLPADQIIIEQTVDGGETWTDAGVSDSIKLQLFCETRPRISLPAINSLMNPLCGLRITVTGMKYDVPEGTPETEKYQYWNADHVLSAERYCQLKAMYFFIAAPSPSTMGVTVQRARGDDPDNWVAVFQDSSFYMTGNSGADYIRFEQGTFGGNVGQTTNFWNYRITLMTRGAAGADTLTVTSTSARQSLYEIRGYGDSWWIGPNEYMKSDRLYSISTNLTAKFPSYVQCHNDKNVPWLTSLPSSGQVIVADGTVGGVKGKTLAAADVSGLQTALDGKAAKTKGIYPVVGTQTAATGAWTGNIDLPELYDGLTIAYYLPYSGSGNATLNLTLSGGGTTGAIEVYFSGVTRATTHYPAGSTILLTYWSAGSISLSGTPTTTARWTRADYTVGSSVYQVYAYGIPGYAGAGGVMQYSIIMQDGTGAWQSLTTTSGTGTSKTRNTTGFRLGMIMYTGSADAVASGAALPSNKQYLQYPFDVRYSLNCGTGTMTMNAPVYLVGTINPIDGLFYLAETWWTQTLPAAADGKVYIYLGYMYAANGIMLVREHPIYEYRNGAVRLWSPGAADLLDQLNELLGVDSGDNGKILGVADGRLMLLNIDAAKMS